MPLRQLDEAEPPLPPRKGHNLASPSDDGDKMWSLRIALSSALSSVSSTTPLLAKSHDHNLRSTSAAVAPSHPATRSASRVSCIAEPSQPIPEPSQPPAPLEPACPEYYVLLSGTLEELEPFSSGSVDWLLDIASLAFGPYAAGVIRCHKDATATYSSSKTQASRGWEVVKRGDTMQAKVYEFTPDAGGVTVSPRCLARTGMSTTFGDLRKSAEDFRRQVVQRDEGCIFTGAPEELCSVCYLIPKRLGAPRIQAIIRSFTRPNTLPEDSTSEDELDPRTAVLGLGSTIEWSIGRFLLGFKPTTDKSTYTVHVFLRQGVTALDGRLTPRLIFHRSTITFKSHSLTPPPPPALLDWHYLQCAFQRFGTDMSKDASRCYDVAPPRERNEDDDEDGEDNRLATLV